MSSGLGCALPWAPWVRVARPKVIPCGSAPSDVMWVAVGGLPDGQRGQAMRVIFFGSGAFAVPSFEMLIDKGYDVAALVTEPDREKGKGPDVPAGAWRLPLLEPADWTDSAAVEKLREHAADVHVVADYGRALPGTVIGAPRLGTVKLHPSLLPRHRGPAPIPWAILSGDTETGVTTFLMDEGVDTGPVFTSRSTPVGAEETAGELEVRLAKLGAEVLHETLARLADGSAKPAAQAKAHASKAPSIEPDTHPLDWSADAQTLDRHIRAFHPLPGTSTLFEGRVLKILRARPGEPRAGEPGTVLVADFSGILVACGGGTALQVTQVQAQDLRPMSPSAFISRVRLRAGSRLG